MYNPYGVIQFMWNLLPFLIAMTFAFNPLFAAQQSIAAFLEMSKERYRQNFDSKNIHIILGNESGDLDSVVSSILYAYFLSREDRAESDALYIPLLNIHREDLLLRKDVDYLLQLAGIPSHTLLFLDDELPLQKLLQHNRLRLHLVDHNALRPKQRHLSSAVVSIIDHHVDECLSYPLLASSHKLIEPVGSSATLIAEKIIANPSITLTLDIAKLLLAPILIDTYDLQSVEKTTDRDRVIAAILKAVVFQTLPENFYEQLLNKKNDATELTSTMLLSKDFKEYLDGALLYGISTLPATVCWEREESSNLAPLLERYTLERGLSLLIILMSNQSQTKLKRTIIVYSPHKSILGAFRSYVQKDVQLSQILIPLHFAEEEQMSFYGTEEFIARKKLQPLFHFTDSSSFEALFEGWDRISD